MKHCSLNHFTDSLKPWLDKAYIHRIVLDGAGRVTFVFQDGVSDTYEITDCSKKKVGKICQDLADQGLTVDGLN